MTSQIDYSFPLRHNFTAQIVVPQDLTTAEALRLRAFLLSIAQPNEERGGDR